MIRRREGGRMTRYERLRLLLAGGAAAAAVFAAGVWAGSAQGDRPYTDLDGLSDEALAAVEWAADCGLMHGYTGGGGEAEFRPHRPMTRVQAAAVLHRWAAGGGCPDASPPGEPFDPAPAGTRAAVIGTPFDEVLIIRRYPGADQPAAAGLAPPADDLTLTGRGRSLPGSSWLEVETPGGAAGWAPAGSIGLAARTSDRTSRAAEALGAGAAAPDMEALGRAVARVFASEEPPSSITMSRPAVEGEKGEVTFDVVGLGDDSVRALRLRVTGVRSPDGGYTLEKVEETAMCHPNRGVTPEGLCT